MAIWYVLILFLISNDCTLPKQLDFYYAIALVLVFMLEVFYQLNFGIETF